MANCTKCGKANADSAKFCTVCGSLLIIQASASTPFKDQSSKKKNSIWILIGILGLLIVVGGVYFLFISKKGFSKNTTNNKEGPVTSIPAKPENSMIEYHKGLFSSFHQSVAANEIERAIDFYDDNVMFNGKSMTPYSIRMDFEKILQKYTPAGTQILSFTNNYGYSYDYEIDYSLYVNDTYDPKIYKKYRIKGVVEFNNNGKIIRIKDLSTVQY